MTKKWFIAALLGLLSIVAIQQLDWVQHNQQLVVQFSQGQSGDEEESLASITAQLEATGALHVTVESLEDGSYSIHYYSTLSTALVKSQIDLADSSGTLPVSTDDDLKIQIDIYEIQQGSDAVADLNGILRADGKQEIRRAAPVYPTIFHRTQVEIDVQELASRREITADSTTSFTSHRTHVIPEVRAGPVFYTS